MLRGEASVRKVALLLCALGMGLGCSGALAQEFDFPMRGQSYIKGNDTGGLMVWSTLTEQHAQEWAGQFCGGYGKYARITSVHRNYGDYISFNCIWNPESAPFILPRVPVDGCRPHRGYTRHTRDRCDD